MLQRKVLVREYSPHLYHCFFLGVDVGGTNISIVLAGLGSGGAGEGERMEMLATFRGKTAEASDVYYPVKEAVEYCLKKFSAQIRAIGIAAAGPVEGHRWCRLTNVDLEIDAEALGDKLNIPCFLLNDFEAQGYAINFLEREKPEAVIKLERDGRKVEGTPGTRALLGAGTGLGKAILIASSELGFYITLPSEGGHADFAAQDLLEWEMVSHIKEVTGFPVYYEDLLSGRGLGNIYSFIRTRSLYPASRFSSLVDGAKDKAPAVARYYQKDKTAGHAVEMFVIIFARCARNFALDVLARGGVYLGGGIAAKNMDWFTDGRFVKEFEEHRQYRALLEQIPVFIIASYEAGIYGAAFVASRGEELWSRIV